VKPVRVLHVIETDGPGGAETMLVGLVSHLDPQFSSTVFLPFGGWLEQALRNARIDLVPQARSPHAIVQIIRLIKTFQPDLVHSHLPDSNFYSVIAGVMTGTKTIVTYHGALDRAWKARIKQKLVSLFATRVVAVSDFLRRALLGIGVAERKCVRI
jgi:hypothetical protein